MSTLAESWFDFTSYSLVLCSFTIGTLIRRSNTWHRCIQYAESASKCTIYCFTSRSIIFHLYGASTCTELLWSENVAKPMSLSHLSDLTATRFLSRLGSLVPPPSMFIIVTLKMSKTGISNENGLITTTCHFAK
jgi:hypothetical protein